MWGLVIKALAQIGKAIVKYGPKIWSKVKTVPGKIKKKFPKKKPGCTQGCSKALLNQKQAANLKRFEDKLPKGHKPVEVKQMPDGSVVMKSEVPGKVPGSSAVYEKTMDAAGNTTKYIKTTYLPDGTLLHVKPKF